MTGATPPQVARPVVGALPAWPAPPDSLPDYATGELPRNGVPRLGSLRNLLVALGVRALKEQGESAVKERDPGLNEKDIPETSVEAEPSPDSVKGTSAMQAPEPMMKPEFLRPPAPPPAQAEERAQEPPPPIDTHREVPDRGAPEEVEVLPYWRGQYRRSR